MLQNYIIFPNFTMYVEIKLYFCIEYQTLRASNMDL